MSRWNQLFKGTIENRPVTLEEWIDEEAHALRVVTNYGRDQLLGDGIPDVIPAVVSSDEAMHVEATSAEDLEVQLVQDGEFSPVAAREIASHARRPR